MEHEITRTDLGHGEVIIDPYSNTQVIRQGSALADAADPNPAPAIERLGTPLADAGGSGELPMKVDEETGRIIMDDYNGKPIG